MATDLRADLVRERAARRVVDEALRQAITDREDYAARYAGALGKLDEARLLAEKWRRSENWLERQLGADLLQLLDDD